MKILQVVHNFPPEFFGGTELYVLRLSQELEKTGHTVHVVCGSENKGEECIGLEENWEGISVTRIARKEEEQPDLIDIYDELVTEKFLEYLKKGSLPKWEVPNMIAKYFTTTAAFELAKQ